jgi:hypothetical protein
MNLLAHGGTAGLIAEVAIGLVVVLLLGSVWLREKRRRARAGLGAAPMRDEE